ncbi:hypothetical protein EM20IM_06545 [Candidatus Methylacidiphilum infernorum]|uniref:Uncharacterized protein n=1 Tax=Candidatus Methylacidiphilum infernorum TaxID=511746 RepID=A0ABX7PT67_9BACT|nr:hypothetical protein [Candidatus Methylacidiphilum infernorum]QSR86165.1 hypothetical protein EM20IM_06545 [Candidatus Methylacidiphilum infernorum]
MDYKHFHIKITATEGGNYQLHAQFHPLWNINKKIDFDQGFINWKDVVDCAKSLHSLFLNLSYWAKQIYRYFQPSNLPDEAEKIRKKSKQTHQSTQNNFTPSNKKDGKPASGKNPKLKNSLDKTESQKQISETANAAQKMAAKAQERAHKKRALSKFPEQDKENNFLASPWIKLMLKNCIRVATAAYKEISQSKADQQAKEKKSKEDFSSYPQTANEKERWSILFGFSTAVQNRNLSERKKDSRAL